MLKHLTWDDLAELYSERTGGRARTRPMDEIFKWAASQPDIEETEDGGLVMKKTRTPKKTKTYQEVEAILKENTASRMSGVAPRDSDNELIIQILQRCRGADFSADQMNIIRSLNFESVTRCRRKFQEAGQFMPSPEVAKKRRLKSYEVEQTAPKETAAGIQRRIENNA